MVLVSGNLHCSVPRRWEYTTHMSAYDPGSICVRPLGLGFAWILFQLGYHAQKGRGKGREMEGSRGGSEGGEALL